MGGRDRIGWETEAVFESVIFVRILRTIIASWMIGRVSVSLREMAGGSGYVWIGGKPAFISMRYVTFCLGVVLPGGQWAVDRSREGGGFAEFYGTWLDISKKVETRRFVEKHFQSNKGQK